jgi:hypothetical protein
LLAPALFSLQTPPFGGVDPGGPGLGCAPQKIKFSKLTHSKEQLLFAGPYPINNPSGNFRRGHCAGYPWGLTFWVAPWLYKLFYKHYIIKVINFIEKFINPIVIPQKHDNYTRKVFDGIGEGGGGGGGVVKAITRTASAVKNHNNIILSLKR